MNVTNLDAFERALEQRVASAGFVGRNFVVRNSGATRTLEKQRLLAALATINRFEPADLAASATVKDVAR